LFEFPTIPTRVNCLNFKTANDGLAEQNVFLRDRKR